MINNCECVAAGFCKRHGVEKDDRHLHLCQHSKVVFDMWERGVGPGHKVQDPQTPTFITEPSSTKIKSPSPVVVSKNGPGSFLKKRFAELGVPPCQSCSVLASKMDAWGPEGCRQNLQVIVNEMLPRATAWLKSNGGWVNKLKAAAPDFAKRAVLESYIIQAIEEAENA